MKTICLNVMIFSLAILLPVLSLAQNSGNLKDSLPILKPKKSGRHYVVNYASIREVRLGYDRPHKHPFPGGKTLSDSLNYTGPSFEAGLLRLNTIRARTFLLRGRLDCSNPGLDWEIALYSEGLVDKTWNRERQEDGSFSLSTDKSIVLFWDKGAGGMIVEKGDTIGRFYITMNPRSDENLTRFSGEVYAHETSRLIPGNIKQGYPEGLHAPMTEFGLYGILRNQHFALLTNGVSLKSFIYSGSELVGIFQSDIDFQPMLKKADRLQPFLQYDGTTSIAFQNDLIRLALMSRLLVEVLGGQVF